jgi:ribosomal protein S18 acetylase RimI-like enzyme
VARIRHVRPDEIDALLDFIVAEQADLSRGTAYIGSERTGVKLELEDLDAWPGAALVAEKNGRIVGATLADTDAALGRSWLYGPWVAGDGWAELARPLLDAAIAVCPPEVTRHEICGDVLHRRMADLAGQLGWKASVPNHVFTVAEAAATDWPPDDPRVRDARTDDFAALEPLHDAEFPGTYLPTRQMIDDGIAGKRITLVSDQDGTVLGYASGWVQPDGAGYLDFFAITPQARGAGAGTGLLVTVCRRIMAAAPDRNVNLTVQDHRAPAIALYRRLGFELETTIVGYSTGSA